MRHHTLMFIAGSALLTAPLAAQQPDSAARAKARADSVARADSIAREDSIRTVREIERIQNEPRKRDSVPKPPPQSPATGVGAPTNPRMLPDFSAVVDLVADLSPHSSTQPDGRRFSVREVELAVQAAIDPYFRGDVFLGFDDLEKVAVEEAALTTTSLGNGFEARAGRYRMPVGKINTTHRHDLHYVEYPYVIQEFFSPEGLRGTGIWGSKIFSPFGFYQEFIVTMIDAFGESPDSLFVQDPANKSLSGLGYSARLRNYWDFSQDKNMEWSFSAVTGKRPQPISGGSDSLNAVNAQQTVVGTDVTYRWRPLKQGLYESFLLQAEFMYQINQKNPAVPTGTTYAGPTSDYPGAYVFGRYQMSQRNFLGARYDWLKDPENNGAPFNAVSLIWEFFPSEFSKLIAEYQYVSRAGYQPSFPAYGTDPHLSRLLLQATFALGPHKPHAF